MVTEGVPFTHYALDEFGVLFGPSTDHEEGSLEIVIAQDVENGGCSSRIRPIIETQGDLMVEPYGFILSCKAR